jgi:rhodanese-related sulfurtransferase
MKTQIRRGTVLACLAMLIAFAFTAFADEIPRVKPEELKGMITGGGKGFLVVDVQPKGAYDLGHIKGAVNFPWSQEIKSAGKLPKGKTLILYCDCGHEEDSTDSAQQLVTKFGYTNVKVLEGGWSGWQKLGYPVEKGKKK